uniref:Uncharacterized protein n=1 Tax=Physcomitrium patens TaxID=3218 RepID=A0A2K1KF89_PHYPA|nr:hypothetical protein PHYPA_008793 [Physcomitrium patens]
MSLYCDANSPNLTNRRAPPATLSRCCDSSRSSTSPPKFSALEVLNRRSGAALLNTKLQHVCKWIRLPLQLITRFINWLSPTQCCCLSRVLASVTTLELTSKFSSTDHHSSIANLTNHQRGSVPYRNLQGGRRFCRTICVDDLLAPRLCKLSKDEVHAIFLVASFTC